MEAKEPLTHLALIYAKASVELSHLRVVRNFFARAVCCGKDIRLEVSPCIVNEITRAPAYVAISKDRHIDDRATLLLIPLITLGAVDIDLAVLILSWV